MRLAGFLVLSLRQTLIYFFSLINQSHVGFIDIFESTHFGLSKTTFTFPGNFSTFELVFTTFEFIFFWVSFAL